MKRKEALIEPWHGTHGGYTNHRCKCKLCREAQRQYQAAYRVKHPERNSRTGRLKAAGER